MTYVQSYDDSCTKSQDEGWQNVFVALKLQANNASSVHVLFEPSREGSTKFSIEAIGEHGMIKKVIFSPAWAKESMTVHFSEPIEIASQRVKAIEFKAIEFQGVDEHTDDWKFLKCCLDVNTLLNR